MIGQSAGEKSSVFIAWVVMMQVTLLTVGTLWRFTIYDDPSGLDALAHTANCRPVPVIQGLGSAMAMAFPMPNLKHAGVKCSLFMHMEKLWVSPLQRTTTSCSTIHGTATGFHLFPTNRTSIMRLVLVQHDHQELISTRIAWEKCYRFSSNEELDEQ